MKAIVLFICSFIVFVSCADSNKSENISKHENLIVLDFDKAPVKDIIPVSTFMKSVTPVFLETTDDNLIGMVSDIQSTDSCICVLDDGSRRNENLFVFDKKGKYLRKIGQKGQGPGEYGGINDFTINEKNDEIFLIDYEFHRICVFKLSTGQFIRNIDFKDENVSYRHIQYNKGKLFVDFTYYKSDVDDGPMVYALNETSGEIESTYLDVAVNNHGWLESYFFGRSYFHCKNSESPKYTQIFMDTVMAISNGRLDPYLVIKSKDWVTADDVKKYKNTTNDVDNDFSFKILKLPIAYNIQNYVESEDYIYFIYYKKGESITTIYDKKHDIVYRTDKLINDIMYNGETVGVHSVCYGDKNGMYEYKDTEVMPYFYRYTLENSSSTIKPEYKKMLEGNMTPDSNPILLYYEYKK